MVQREDYSKAWVTTPSYTEVTTTEWRWLVLIGGALVALILLPYLLAFLGWNVPSDYQFTGVLYAPLDGATYVAKIQQGIDGAWRTTLTHTPEPHKGIFFNTFYTLLGHLAGIFGFSSLQMFHVSRLVLSLAMFVALYHLGSAIWGKVRSRRLFFMLVTIGSGLGWVVLLLWPDSNYTQLPSDLTLVESSPLLASLAHPHLPLAIALIAGIVAMCVAVTRPGFREIPTIFNGGLGAAIASALLATIMPQGWLPLASALVGYLLISLIRTRSIPHLELQWMALIIVAGIPMLIYYYAAIQANPFFANWLYQARQEPPALWRYLLGYGLPLLIAIPAIWRAITRLERDGDRFMLFYLAGSVLWLVLPAPYPVGYSVGMIIPIAYFAVRAIEEFWLNLIPLHLRDLALAILLLLILPSNIIVAVKPLSQLSETRISVDAGTLLSKNDVAALQAIQSYAEAQDVVLAPVPVSLWIPALTSQKVVYGHHAETAFAAEKKLQLWLWFNARYGCHSLVERYQVRFIITQGNSCLSELGLQTPLYEYGDVAVYRLR
ncbi:MAG: hypothetical protein OHK0023_19900 [Anaerolineae bacterium]